MFPIGMHVEIKRSDGRVHGAVIIEVKPEGQYEVEWYEKGETKLKEFSMDELLTLNPTLQTPKPTPVQPPPPQKTLQTSTDNINQSYPQQEVSPSNGNFAFAEMIRNYRAQIDYRPLGMFDSVNENRISVCLRKRPLNTKELTKNEVDVITIPSRDITILHQPQTRVDLTKCLDNQKFRFDYCFDEYGNNELVYRFTAAPLVKTIFENGNATCFAYGQTGTGKTHTMGGDFSGKKQNASKGIYALTARDVFHMLDQPQYRGKYLSVHCAFFEIYGTKTFDLLNERAELVMQLNNLISQWSQ
ncbi:hypothetical protein GCK72_011820 [Caenorhabditis remanei]|uniref:Kinesin motor domain-containing protein n=1 Tax=Caenorhabditis remanei TaxID=31234 RepID=A0A6A5H9Q5_CAERE|nr:hypothetical protein GCK72_011820 [Caenorhabditis remanei]KAF1763554.1 hypothetical protein GCK72_011820 [Caenorhabditis remanei]